MALQIKRNLRKRETSCNTTFPHIFDPLGKKKYIATMNKTLIVSLFFSLCAFAAENGSPMRMSIHGENGSPQLAAIPHAENGIANNDSSIDVCSVDVCKPVSKAEIPSLDSRDQEELGAAVELLRNIGAENGLSDDQLRDVILQQLKL